MGLELMDTLYGYFLNAFTNLNVFAKNSNCHLKSYYQSLSLVVLF